MSLAKTLRTFDLVLFNVAAIVGLRWVALTAHSGPSSLVLWVLAAVAFFIPQGLCVMTLSSAMPKEGGLYVWISEAFGERHGFIAGWLYCDAAVTSSRLIPAPPAALAGRLSAVALYCPPAAA